MFPRACGLFLLRWLISAAPPCGCLHKSERGANSGSLYRPPGAVAVVAPWGSKPKPAASGAAARICPATTPKRHLRWMKRGGVGAALRFLQERIASRSKNRLSAREGREYRSTAQGLAVSSRVGRSCRPLVSTSKKLSRRESAGLHQVTPRIPLAACRSRQRKTVAARACRHHEVTPRTKNCRGAGPPAP